MTSGLLVRPPWAHLPGRPSWAHLPRRPLLAALVTVTAGAMIVFLPAGRYTVLLLPGVAGTSGFALGGLICLAGLFLFASPRLHGPLGAAVVLLSLTALVTTNLGGFLVGTLLGVVGGSLGFAWTDRARRPRPGRHRDMRLAEGPPAR